MLMKEGRYFYFGRPLCASSWRLESRVSLMSAPNVKQVILEMCALGLTTLDEVASVATFLQTDAAATHRATCAFLNHLCLDRFDLCFSR